MKHRSILSPSLLGWLSATGISGVLFDVSAQAPPPPLPAPVDAQEVPVEGDPPTPSSPQSETGQTSPGSAEATPPGEEGTPAQEATADQQTTQEPWEQPVDDPAAESSAWSEEGIEENAENPWFRKVSLQRQSTLSGSTGLHRVKEAGSGAPGTFRFGLTGGFFSGSGFLCNDEAPCTDPITGQVLGEDSAQRSELILTLSVTPFSFLEAFMSIHSSATSNDNGAPQLLQVVGDTNFGVKGFIPQSPNQIFNFGGEADLYLLTGSGGVGLAGGATSFAIRGLTSMNLNNRTNESDRIPLRAHFNLGYYFDNSGKVVEDLETTPPPEGRGAPIERTERYGLGISRVDSLEIGLGAEYVNPYFRPFLEWTLDVPANRQSYRCNENEAASRGDLCLKIGAGLSSSPSRLTFGSRFFPWQDSGLALTGAIDLGTGATSEFLEEVTPEAPYSLWFALAYAVDTVPPAPEQVALAAPPSMRPETRRYVLGRVLENTQGSGIPDAIIRYDGVPMTGLVADQTGQFISQDLPPGEYTFKIFAEQFREGVCTISIPETAEPQQATAPTTAPEGDSSLEEDPSSDPNAAPPAPDSEAIDAVASAEPYMDQDGNILVPLDCHLEELPRVADIVGLLVDSKSGGPVPGASVTITDKLDRKLKLAVDALGSFQFRNVPFGAAHLTASAPGYLTTVTPMNVDVRKGLSPHLLMNARPEKLALKVGRREIKLDRSIDFVTDKAVVTIDSMSMLEELAEALKDNEELSSVEIQVHSDDSGAASYSRQLSQERANGIRDILIYLGVAKDRLSSKGFGPDQPLAPNVSDANRAANNRVQFMLQKSVAEF